MRKLPVILLFCMLPYLLAIEAQPVNAQASSAFELSAGYISENVPMETLSTSVPGTPIHTPESTIIPSFVVQIATPDADGRVIHIVVSGQTLIIIADAYGVDIKNLMALNGLNQDSVIYPDQELVIRAGFTATPTSPPTVTATQTKVPTSTRRPTRTPVPRAEAGNTGDLTEATQPVLTPTVSSAQPKSDAISNVLLVIISVLGLGGILLIVVGALLRRST